LRTGHDRIEVGGDHCGQLVGCIWPGLPYRGNPEALVFLGHVFEGFHQQGVLAAEIEIDDALGKPRRLGHLPEREFGKAPLGQAVDRRLDQLDPPRLLDVEPAPHLSLPRTGFRSAAGPAFIRESRALNQ